MDAPQKPTTDRDYMLFAFRVMAEFGGILAVPVLFLTWAGRALDARYGTGKTFFFLGLVAAAAVSARAVYVRAKQLGAQYAALGAAEKPRDAKPPSL